MIEALALGLGYGLSAGIAPGPLLALVIKGSLRDGVRAGLEAAVAPVVADAVVIVVALTALSSLSDRALGIIGVLGALLVGRTAADSWTEARTADPMVDAERARAVKRRRYLRRGAMLNALSPRPALFWFTAGGPTAIRLHDGGGTADAVLFVAAVLAAAVSVRVAVAVVAGAAGRRIGGLSYRIVLSASAAALAVLAVALAVESLLLVW